MKKGLIIVGECLVLIFVLVMIKNVLSNRIPEMQDSDVLSFILYFISGMGSVLIYRFHTNRKSK